MADRKATNKYYPPDWDPSKGSLNTYQGQHALRHRARKLNQGILIVRFEMPFPIICGGCEANIGMGVRYNAEKKKVGNYFSTPIFQFTMKCHLCPNKIVVQTDPKNTAYNVIQGGVKKTIIWDPEDSETIELKDKDNEKPQNPFNKLEHKTKDLNKAKADAPRLMELQSVNQKHWDDPYSQSQKMRSIFRKGRKEREAAEVRTNQLKDKYSLFIELEPESKEDEIEAKKKQFKSNNQLIEKLEKTKEESLTSNLFNNTTTSANKSISTSSSLNNLKTQFNQINDPFVNNTQTKPNSNGPLIKIKKVAKVSNIKKEETQPLISLLGYASDSESDS